MVKRSRLGSDQRPLFASIRVHSRFQIRVWLGEKRFICGFHWMAGTGLNEAGYIRNVFSLAEAMKCITFAAE
jgi:hypothetical protein